MSENTLRGKALQHGITFACGSGFLLFGYDQGVYGGLLTNPRFLAQFNHPGSVIQSQIVSTYYLGCILGAVVSRFIGDKIGRRRAILLGCTWLTVGGAIQASAFGLPQMLCGRIIGGIGTGLNTTAIPMWQVECSKKSHRGRLIILQLVLNIFGIVITSWMNFGFTFGPDSSVTWRFPAAFQCFWSIVTFCATLVMCESPRWLVLRDRPEEARAIIARLLDRPTNSSEVEEDLRVIVDAVSREMEEPPITLKEILRNGRQHNLRRILLGCGVALMQQISGTNVMANYLPIVLTRSVGLSDRLSLILTACNSISLMLAGTAAAFFIDSFGRKKLMLLGATAQSISFFLVAICLSVKNDSGSIAAVVFIFTYYIFYGLSFLSIPWLYPAEINSQRMRNVGASASTTTNWVFVYVIVLITPIGIDNLGWRFYLIFGFFNAAFFPLVWVFYIETAKLSLEQIDRVFEIKSDGGNSVSWKQARQMALMEEPEVHSDEDTSKPGEQHVEVP
ncbi:hexose carrier protein [Xylariomycetidae sp. FL0641]|nr:hexose carrier protein [Xylariomycetidae sp. FL0641]